MSKARLTVERPGTVPNSLIFLHAQSGGGLGRSTYTLSAEDARQLGRELIDAGNAGRLETPGKTYDHEPAPDDLPEAGDRCKSCGEDITWVGPGQYDWLHVDDKENRS